jgi:hypothetical protein
MRTDEKYFKYKELKKAGKIPKESKKRKKEHLTYLKQIEMFKEESIANNTYVCFFCGKKAYDGIDGYLCVHHLVGRVGDYYLDKETWVWAHNLCHNKFHFSTTEDLIQEPWWDDFMSRLKDKNTEVYHKIQKRIEKSKNLFGYLE